MSETEKGHIRVRDLVRLSGVDSVTIKNWKKHGYMPKHGTVPVEYVDVCRDVASLVRAGFRLRVAFEKAKGFHIKTEAAE